MPSEAANIRLLIDAVLDGRATADEMRLLETAAMADPAVLRQYVDAVNLHASMQWDYGDVLKTEGLTESLDRTPVGVAPIESKRRFKVVGNLVAAAAVIAIGVFVWQGDGGGDPVVDNDPRGNGPKVVDVVPDVPETVRDGVLDGPGAVVVAESDDEPRPRVNDLPVAPRLVVDEPSVEPAVAATVKDEPVVELASFVDQRLEERWLDEGVTPSPRATPSAWLRRASLDIKGRIPTRAEITEFITAPEATRRFDFVTDALASPEYADHFATVWSNLLIGRSSQRAEYRDRLHGYLVDRFATNQSWGQVAGELVSAEGTEDNAPTNFLLAHLNNEAVPATAITSRVLLGRQVQCTQCHHHPFNDWKQDEFWQLNAFFQQCKVESRDEDGGRRVQALVDRKTGGGTFFENRRGVMQVAYPIFGGERVDESRDVRRREELARLIVTGDKTDLAVAMVNRVWAHFHGAGFTRDIDDIGPHAAVSHPELLDRLAREFVASDYDVKQLISWVTGSAAYQLSGELGSGNSFDRPEAGETALFSRVYEKSLSPEQLYDSLVTAAAGPRRRVPGLPSRSEWVAEFYAAQENEENGEMSTFEASPSVALELMNGSLISSLVNSPKARALTDVLTLDGNEDDRLDALSLLVLGRTATGPEKATLRKVLRPTIKMYARELPGTRAVEEGYRDLFWAYVNSSEFAVNR